jgi:patched domain-containing protein
MKEGLGHGGPSITITSFTNAVAFFIGAQSSTIALRSFCMFAGFAIIMLYYGVLTVFAATLAFDMRRQAKLWGDCCGLCCCAETSICCCRGYFLSPTQKRHSA